MSTPQKRERDSEPLAAEPKRPNLAADRQSLTLSRPDLPPERVELAIDRARQLVLDLAKIGTDPIETLSVQLRNRKNRFRDVARVCSLALHYRVFLRRHGSVAHPDIVATDFVGQEISADFAESLACVWTAALEFYADVDRMIQIDSAL